MTYRDETDHAFTAQQRIMAGYMALAIDLRMDLEPLGAEDEDLPADYWRDHGGEACWEPTDSDLEEMAEEFELMSCFGGRHNAYESIDCPF